MNKERIAELQAYLKGAYFLQKLIDSEAVLWEVKYDVGFKLKLDVDDYCDPDMGYEEDSKAYNNAV